jgi:hypothetical protein
MHRHLALTNRIATAMPPLAPAYHATSTARPLALFSRAARTARRLALAIAVACALAAHPARATQFGLEASGQLGLGTSNIGGTHGWLESSPTFAFASAGIRADRWVAGVMVGGATTDTTFTRNPLSGRPLLIGGNPTESFRESIHTYFFLFTIRADAFRIPRDINPYVSVGIGTGQLTDRVNGGTQRTTISYSIGRPTWTAAVGAQSRPLALPVLHALHSAVYIEARYLNRKPSGLSARGGYHYRDDYSPYWNYTNAVNNAIFSVDAPPGRVTYIAVSAGLRLGLNL